MKKLLPIITLLFATNAFAQVPNYVPSNGLIGWWPFCGNANDMSGNGYDGTVTGASLASDRFGNSNAAYIYNGTTNYITTTAVESNITTYTISAWFKSSVGGYMVTSGFNQGGIVTYLHNQATGGSNVGKVTYYQENNGGAFGSLTQATYIDNQWHHFVGVLNGFATGNLHPDSMKIYIDGVFVANDNATTTNGSFPANPNMPILFGGTPSLPSSFFNGELDDIGIWNRALTLAEISSLFSVTCVNQITATVTPQSATTFCQGGSVTLNANAGNNYMYQWLLNGNTINNATSSSYTANQSGSYSVVICDGYCAATSIPVVVTVSQYPNSGVTISGNTTFCQGGSVTLTSQGTGTYLWSPNGETTQAISATQSGSYSVTVTNNGCSVTSQATTVTVNQLPTATITPQSNTTFCQGGFVTLTASGGGTYLWNTGATTQAINATQSNNYTVVVTANGCSATSTATSVTVNPNPTVTLSPISALCSNAQAVMLTGGSPANGSYTLDGNSATSIQPWLLSAGSHPVIYSYTDGNGCSGSASQNVTINAAPTVTLSGLGASYIVTDAPVQLSGTPAGGIFTGAGVQGNMFDPSVAGVGTHSIIYMYSNGCMNADGLCTTVELQVGNGGVDMFGNGGTFSVIPNPNSGSFSINLNSLNPLGLITLAIYNSVGQLIQSEVINTQSNTLKKQIDLNLAQGIYHITLQTNGGLMTKKIEIVK